jgi:hypothetical protein
MKKGMIIWCVVLTVWLAGLTWFMVGQIVWNHYIVDKVNQGVDAINAMYEPVDNSMVR